MKRLRYLLLALLLGCLVPGLSAAPADVPRGTTPAPLRSLDGRAVFNVAKDADGYVWMVTRTGASRFDGRSVRYYPLVGSELLTDGDGHQTALRIDREGRLWVFTDSGKLFCYNPWSDSFEQRLNLSDYDSGVLLNDIFFDAAGRLWLGTTAGLLEADARTFSPDREHTSLRLAGHNVNCIVPLADDNLAVGTNEGIFLLSGSTPLSDGERILAEHNVTSIYYDSRSGLLWAGTFGSGLRLWDLTAGREAGAPWLRNIPASPIRVIRPMGGDKLLAGVDGGGVYLLDLQARRAARYLSENEEFGGQLRGNGVYDLLPDGEHVWVATYTGGISLVNVSDKFCLISRTPFGDPGQSLGDNHVNAVLEARDGDMWFATNHGVSLWRVRENRWSQLIRDDNTYLTLCETTDGRVWCGGYSTGVHLLDKRGGGRVVRSVRSLGGGSRADCIYASLVDDDGNVWFGGLNNRLTCLHGGGQTAYDIRGVNSVVRVDADRLMVNTTRGFCLLNRRNGTFRRLFADPDDYGVRSNSFIYNSIALGDELWFGTSGGGLNLFDLGDGTVRNFTMEDGLPSNFIFSIQQDRAGNLWISTDGGICCFDPRERRLLFNIGQSPVSQFVFSSGCTLRDGRIAFGSIAGCLLFDPQVIRPAAPKVEFRFTEFRLFYEPVTAQSAPGVLTAPIDRVEHIRLRHRQNTFSFGFTALDLYHSDKYLYTYRLEGFDGKWLPAGSYSGAEYTNIPPGEYRFRVRCIDKESRAVLVERAIGLRVLPPWWATGTAMAAYLLALLALLCAAARWWQRRQERRHMDEKLSLFIDIAHDIRTPLSLVIAPLRDLSRETLSEQGAYCLDLARQNCEKLFSMVQGLLDIHKMEIAASAVVPSAVCPGKLLRRKYDEFEPMAARKGVTLCLEDGTDGVVVMVDFDKFNHVLDNLLSNAVKYTPRGGRVTVRLSRSGKKLVFEVCDTGIGIAEGDRKHIFRKFYRSQNAVQTGEIGSGVGLVITRRLVGRMKGTLTFDSREGEGTVFRLTLPCVEPPAESAAAVPKDPDPVPEGEPGAGEELCEGMDRVLVVEDNADMRSYLSYSLSSDYKVYAVASGEEALAFLAGHSVDIVISDVMMGGGISGIELCARLKGDIATSHLFVILLTACTRQESILSGFESGANDYITKPFSIDVLHMKLNNLMQTRRIIREQGNAVVERMASPGEASEVAPAINGIDNDFLRRSMEVVAANLSDSAFSINDLCREMAVSRTLMYEKLRALAGQSPSDFIRGIRLRRAYELLQSADHSVAEVAVLAGFSDAKYFSTVFKKHFGESPSQVPQSRRSASRRG